MRCSLAISLLVFPAIVWLFPPQPLGAQAAPPLTPSDIIVQYDVPMKTRDGVTLYADIYRPEIFRKVSRHPHAYALRQKRQLGGCSPAFKMVSRGYVVIIQDVRGRYTFGRGMVSVQARAGRRLRYGRMGCGASLFRWKSWHDGRFLRGRDANAGGDCSTSASGGDCTEHDRKQLSRWLDLPVRAH